MCTLRHDITNRLAAGFAGIWIVSDEPHDVLEVLRDIKKNSTKRSMTLKEWNVETGLSINGAALEDADIEPTLLIRAHRKAEKESDQDILIMKNLHLFFDRSERLGLIEAIDEFIRVGKTDGKYLIIIAPTVNLPLEITRLFTVIHHKLPESEDYKKILDGMQLKIENIDDVIKASAGLTRVEAENAYALSYVENKVIRAKTVWTLKAESLKKEGLLELYQGNDSFEQLGGMTYLKDFCRSVLTNPKPNPKAKPKGVMLWGVSGAGKSAFAKALGNETNRPTIIFDISRFMNKWQGDSEKNIRRSLELVDTMAPCILFIDEVEKALAGAGSSGESDSGTMGRMFGTLLTWMNDHTSEVFYVCTCNDVQKILSSNPEFGRAERSDKLFFIDVPTREQKDRIWDIYMSFFELPKQKRPDDKQWTGAEIKACCRMTAMRGTSLIEEARTLPIMDKIAGQRNEILRRQASGLCASVEINDLYYYEMNAQKDEPAKPKRKIHPSDN